MIETLNILCGITKGSGLPLTIKPLVLSMKKGNLFSLHPFIWLSRFFRLNPDRFQRMISYEEGWDVGE